MCVCVRVCVEVCVCGSVCVWKCVCACVRAHERVCIELYAKPQAESGEKRCKQQISQLERKLAAVAATESHVTLTSRQIASPHTSAAPSQRDPPSSNSRFVGALACLALRRCLQLSIETVAIDSCDCLSRFTIYII
jgi:hypothetical protein